MATLPPEKIDEFRRDLELVQKAVKAGVTHKRSQAMDNHWGRWDAYCLDHNLDPFLRSHNDPVPILQVFAQSYKDGRLAPSGQSVKSRTVENAIRAVAQKYASVGTKDPRLDFFGKTDFRIARQLRAYKKTDKPTTRVKPVPITLIIFILQQAYNDTRRSDQCLLANIICVAFFFLLRPGEYTGTTRDDRPFHLEDVALFLHQRRLQFWTAPRHEIEAATNVSYTFTTQKNGEMNEVLSHGRSGHPLCCPVTATIRLILYHRDQLNPDGSFRSQPTTPISSYYKNNALVPVKPKDITDILRTTATLQYHVIGIRASEISARSLRAGGAMALLCGKVNQCLIKMLGRWHSNAMMRYSHLQAFPIMSQFTPAMFNNGTFSFLPNETVPLQKYH